HDEDVKRETLYVNRKEKNIEVGGLFTFHLLRSRLRGFKRLRLYGGAVVHEIFPGDDHLLRPVQALGDLNSILVADSNLHRHAVGLSFAHNVDILGVFQSTHCIDGDLNRASMDADHDLYTCEHAAFQDMIFVGEIHLDRHSSGGSVQRLDDTGDCAFEDAVGIGFGADLR